MHEQREEWPERGSKGRTRAHRWCCWPSRSVNVLVQTIRLGLCIALQCPKWQRLFKRELLCTRRRLAWRLPPACLLACGFAARSPLSSAQCAASRPLRCACFACLLSKTSALWLWPLLSAPAHSALGGSYSAPCSGGVVAARRRHAQPEHRDGQGCAAPALLLALRRCCLTCRQPHLTA